MRIVWKNIIMKNKKEINSRMYLLKAIAIFTVVLAHTNCDLIQNPIDYYLIKRLSAIGVFSFFFLSGYYFRVKKWSLFFSVNLQRLIIPWFVLGSFNYLLGCFKSGEEIYLIEYLKYLFGSGSMYYFCTVLLILKIAMNYICIKNNRLGIHYFFIGLTVLSIAMSATLSPMVKEYSYDIVTPYLNIFNWIGIFSLGIVAKEKDLIARYHTLDLKWKLLIYATTAVFWVIGYTDCEFGYFGRYSFVCEFGMMLTIIEVLFLFSVDNRGIQFLEMIGKNTLTVYLLHYPLLSILQKNSIFNGSVIFVFARCFICASTLAIFAALLKKLCANKRLYWTKVLFGIR